MASSDDYLTRRYEDRSRAPVPASRRHDSHGTHDSRDQRRSDDKRKTVPGLVTDPYDNLTEIERAVQRGQQESINRSQNRYSAPKRSPNDRSPSNFLTSPIATFTPPHVRPSLRDTYFDFDSKKPPINSSLLAFLPGLAGCGLLVAAIVLTNWRIVSSINEANSQIVYEGLFQVCTSFIPTGSQANNQSCVTLDTFSNDGSVASMLEQATRGLVIIAAGISFIAVIVCIFLGVRRWQRKRGALITASIFTLAGLCAGGGMGCYSAVLLDAINFASGGTIVFAGSSFYFGWCGTGCLFIATMIVFMAHCTRRN